MQIHSLSFDDFHEDNYTLIGIHTTLEDYKLAYLLNKQLKTTFSIATDHLDFENKKGNTSFSVYKYTNSKYDTEWHLIANNFSEENTSSFKHTLFETETKNYLIPDKKNIDFFIKIIGETNHQFINSTINSIKNIHEVITSYTIDTTTLKSKESLIF